MLDGAFVKIRSRKAATFDNFGPGRNVRSLTDLGIAKVVWGYHACL